MLRRTDDFAQKNSRLMFTTKAQKAQSFLCNLFTYSTFAPLW
jgi:hypothetical protein